jgi:hypothetical protein
LIVAKKQVIPAQCIGTTSEEIESGAEHREVPQEGAVVEPVKGRKKPHRGRKLTLGRRGEQKELTQEICGSRKELADAGRKMTRRVEVARREGNFVREYSTRENVATKTRKGRRKNQTKNKFARGNRKVRSLGSRNRDFKKQLHLESERTTSGINRKTIGLEIMKPSVGISSGLWQMRNWRLWRGRSPSKLAEEAVLA